MQTLTTALKEEAGKIGIMAVGLNIIRLKLVGINWMSTTRL